MERILRTAESLIKLADDLGATFGFVGAILGGIIGWLFGVCIFFSPVFLVIFLWGR